MRLAAAAGRSVGHAVLGREHGRVTPFISVARSLALYLLVGALALSVLVSDPGITRSWGFVTVLLFYGSSAVSTFGLIWSVQHRRTAFLGIFYFLFLFYFIAARVQIGARWDIMFYDEFTVRLAFAIVLLFAVVVLCFMLAKPISGVREAPQNKKWSIRSTQHIVKILALCAVVDLLVFLFLKPYLFSYVEVFGEQLRMRIGSQLYLVLRNFLLPLLYLVPMICTLVLWRRRAIGAVCVGTLLMAIGFVFNNPTITSRFLVATLLIGTCSLALGPRKTFPILLMLLAGTYISPLFHAFRGESFSMGTLGHDALLTFDYDSASVLVYGVAYVAERGITYGANLLSALLFFIPDELWTGKLDATGQYLRDWLILEYRFSPLRTATPIFLEGYLAFKWVGVVLVASVWGYVARWLDRELVSADLALRLRSVRSVLLAFAPMMFILLSRGTLMSALACTSGLAAAVWVAVALVRRREPIRRVRRSGLTRVSPQARQQSTVSDQYAASC